MRCLPCAENNSVRRRRSPPCTSSFRAVAGLRSAPSGSAGEASFRLLHRRELQSRPCRAGWTGLCRPVGTAGASGEGNGESGGIALALALQQHAGRVPGEQNAGPGAGPRCRPRRKISDGEQPRAGSTGLPEFPAAAHSRRSSFIARGGRPAVHWQRGDALHGFALGRRSAQACIPFQFGSKPGDCHRARSTAHDILAGSAGRTSFPNTDLRQQSDFVGHLQRE